MGDELYWVDEKGNKRDAELHDDQFIQMKCLKIMLVSMLKS